MIKKDEFVTAEIKLYYDLYLPKGIPTPAPLLITVHGYAAHKRYMMREAQLVAPEQFAIASLEGPNRFWRVDKEGDYRPVAGWLTDQRSPESVALHQRFILDVIAKHAEAGEIDPERVYLHGFSQACALNFRFAFTHPQVLKGLVGICGGIPGDLDENPDYSPSESDVLYVYTDKDDFYDLERFKEFEKRLSDYLPSFTARQYGGTHQITDPMREDIRAWLEQKESG